MFVTSSGGREPLCCNISSQNKPNLRNALADSLVLLLSNNSIALEKDLYDSSWSL